MSKMTEKMSKASASAVDVADPGVGIPKKGECFKCEKCGMAVCVTADCQCEGPDHAHFHCCGQEMVKA